MWHLLYQEEADYGGFMRVARPLLYSADGAVYASHKAHNVDMGLNYQEGGGEVQQSGEASAGDAPAPPQEEGARQEGEKPLPEAVQQGQEPAPAPGRSAGRRTRTRKGGKKVTTRSRSKTWNTWRIRLGCP